MANLEVIDLTPEMAKEFLDTAGPNAPLKRHKVDEYKQKMLAGEWGLEYEKRGRKVQSPPINRPNGKMVNGQHRCTACYESGVTIPVRIRRSKGQV